MATKSIEKNIVITEPDKAKALIEALEASERDNNPLDKNDSDLVDFIDTIDMWAKRRWDEYFNKR